jgi:hypothetical protein
MHGHMKVKKIRRNLNTPPNIPNTNRNIAGNLSDSCLYGNNLCALPNSSFLLVCKRLQSCVWERKNCFMGSCVDEMLGNTESIHTRVD